MCVENSITLFFFFRYQSLACKKYIIVSTIKTIFYSGRILYNNNIQGVRTVRHYVIKIIIWRYVIFFVTWIYNHPVYNIIRYRIVIFCVRCSIEIFTLVIIMIHILLLCIVCYLIFTYSSYLYNVFLKCTLRPTYILMVLK